MKVSDLAIIELIRLNQNRTLDTRLTKYSRDQAAETISALTELLKLRRGVPVEGMVS